MGISMRGNFKVGKLYFLRVDDHSFGMDRIAVVEVVGWCIKDHPKYAVFSPWRVDDHDKEVVDANREPFTIVKSCITKKRVINIT